MATVATALLIVAGCSGSTTPTTASAPAAPKTTTATTPTTVGDQSAASLCKERATLDEQEKQLSDKLTAEMASGSKNVATTDAQHQTVLRELADVLHRMFRVGEEHGVLATELDDLCRDPEKTTTIDPTLLLCVQRAALGSEEQQLNKQLTASVAANAPDAGKLDAEHQAVLLEQSDVKQRIVSAQKRGVVVCPAP